MHEVLRAMGLTRRATFHGHGPLTLTELPAVDPHNLVDHPGAFAALLASGWGKAGRKPVLSPRPVVSNR
jgi:hypothetical protein